MDKIGIGIINKWFQILWAILAICISNCTFPGEKGEKGEKDEKGEKGEMGIKIDQGTRSMCSGSSIRIFGSKIFNFNKENRIFWVKNINIWSLK